MILSIKINSFEYRIASSIPIVIERRRKQKNHQSEENKTKQDEWERLGSHWFLSSNIAINLWETGIR